MEYNLLFGAARTCCVIIAHVPLWKQHPQIFKLCVPWSLLGSSCHRWYFVFNNTLCNRGVLYALKLNFHESYHRDIHSRNDMVALVLKVNQNLHGPPDMFKYDSATIECNYVSVKYVKYVSVHTFPHIRFRMYFTYVTLISVAIHA